LPQLQQPAVTGIRFAKFEVDKRAKEMEHILDKIPVREDDLCTGPLSPFDPSLQVLVVDVSQVGRTQAARILEKLGHHARLAESKEQALEILSSRRFDLALMDAEMATSDSLAVTTAIRERERLTGRRLPIVAITASSDEQANRSGLPASIDGYVCKPISARELRTEIDRIVFAPPLKEHQNAAD
jgi:CheY-like chemotaxis protein